MGRISAIMVMKNEADRYLESCIESIWAWAQDIYVYDDQSTDDSVEIATKLRCTVTVRRYDEPSFLDHEGLFRYNAWRAFQQAADSKAPDWVFAIDADEFLVVKAGLVADAVGASISTASMSVSTGVTLPIPEVFSVDTVDKLLVNPQVRTDGYWGKIKAPRLFEWRRGGQFSDKAMGCGSEPTYVGASRLSPYTHGLSLLHLGYAAPADRQAKSARYASRLHGHADAHIASILKTPTLTPWEGTWPDIKSPRK